MRRGFTIIELLVVVTIIVVLLALLTPALGKAIYQSRLLGCAGGQLKVMAGGVLQYTLDYKRRYPDRDIEQTDRGDTITYLPAMALAYPSQGFDSRPPLRTIFDINKVVQCPFNEPVEMDKTPEDVNVEASYMMLWGWQYKLQNRTLPGMFRLGDRFEFLHPDGRVARYNVLAGDMDLRYGEAQSIQASHPDRDPATMWAMVAVEAPGFWPRNNLSRWVNNLNYTRGAVELNFAFDDGSVQQLPGVIGWNRHDERVDRLYLQYDVRRTGDQFHVPTGR